METPWLWRPPGCGGPLVVEAPGQMLSLPSPISGPGSPLIQRERNVLFNDALNTFYLRLYGVRHMVMGTILIVRKETRCRHIGYSFRLAARVLLYAPSHRQDSTYHGLCYTSRGALAGTRNSSMGSFNTIYYFCSEERGGGGGRKTRTLCTLVIMMMMIVNGPLETVCRL